jgi:hypothetical protein
MSDEYGKGREDQYRGFAEACLKLALGTDDPALRTMYISMAQSWNELASRNSPLGPKIAIDVPDRRQLAS